MSTLAVALALSAAAAVVPHHIPLHRAAPTTGAAVWMLSLVLRALIVVGVATFAFGRLAHSEPLEGALSWCWHVVLPDIPHRLGFAEHPVAHAVVAVPLFAIAGAVLANACGGLRS